MLEISPETDGGAVCLHLSGVIDESFEPHKLFSYLGGDVARITVLDLEGVKRITSFGVRQWSEAMKALPPEVAHLYLVRCPPSFVDQLNMVLNFGGRSEVVTIDALYFCQRCGEERRVPVDVLADRAKLARNQTLPASCSTCGSALLFDEDPQQYFRFLQSYGARSLDPAAATLLENIGLYHMKPVDRPPEEVKLVHGDVTLLCLSGILDVRFRHRRLAAGVEGHVVFDLREVQGLDAEGAARWRKLLEELTGAGVITVVDLPEVLLPSAASGLMTLERTVLHSVRARYRCDTCSNQMRESLRPSQMAAPRPPICSRCGDPTELATDRTTLKRLFARADTSEELPASVRKVVDERGELLSRARAESGVRSVDDGLSRYRVLRQLSRGGMAEVLLAVHQGIGGFEKLIALKKIRKHFLERRHIAVELFLNEAKIAANLNHPNIAQVFEVGEHGGDLFIAMEYVHGVDLREVMHAGVTCGKPLSLELALFIASQVAAALDHANTARDLTGRPLEIVHRDVSPSNIVIGYDGQVKLVDFGVATAKVVTEAHDGILGKLGYMSPEQARHEPLDGRSDLFALGVVLHEMLSRSPLFRRDTNRDTLDAVKKAPIPRLSVFGIPAEVEQVVLTALARDRNHRFQSARAMGLSIADCLQRVLRSSVDVHDLGCYLREIYGEQAAKPPVESTIVDPTESSDDDPTLA